MDRKVKRKKNSAESKITNTENDTGLIMTAVLKAKNVWEVDC